MYKIDPNHFPKRSCDSSILEQSVILRHITCHSLTNQEGGTIMINHFRPHPIGVNKPMLLMQQPTFPERSFYLEIPMSHQKCFQTIGVEQPRPRVCDISILSFGEIISGAVEEKYMPKKSGTLVVRVWVRTWT